MLNGKLRIAPTCYHVLHLIPVMSAHEMGFFYDEGLRSEDGSPCYQILRRAMVPFGLEKLGELNYDVPPIADVCAQDLVSEAYKELLQRNELKEEYGRVSAVAQRWGY